jgi:rhodanese-related sulfurtransferase
MENQTIVKEICPTTTQEWIKNGALLVDVREPEEVTFMAYDVPHILHIPLTDFESRFYEIPKDQAVVMVCKSGGRSLRAAGFLIHQGYNNVVNMKEGILGWSQKGFPIKGNKSQTTNNNSCCDTPGCC